MPFTNNIQSDVLYWLLNGVSLNAIGPLYLGLSSTAPTSSGTNITEPWSISGTNYQRVTVYGGWANDPPGSGGVTYYNTAQLTFPIISGSAWGTLGYFFLATSATQTGNAVVVYGPLSGTISPSGNEVVVFNPGDIQITLD